MRSCAEYELATWFVADHERDDGRTERHFLRHVIWKVDLGGSTNLEQSTAAVTGSVSIVSEGDGVGAFAPNEDTGNTFNAWLKGGAFDCHRELGCDSCS